MNIDQRKPSELKPWIDKYPEELLPKLQKAACSLNDGLWQNNLENMYGTALCYDQAKISFKEMKDSVFCAARGLIKIGVRSGEIVGICASAVPEALYMIYAVDLIGAVPLILSPEIQREALHDCLAYTKSRVLVTMDTLYPEVQKAVSGTLISKVIVLSRADSMRGMKKTIYRLKHKDKNQYDAYAAMWLDFYYLGTDPLEKMNIMEYTSDRTGVLFRKEDDDAGKLVMLSLESVNAVAFQYGVDHFTQRERTFDLHSLGSAFGFICGIHAPLAHGAAVLMLSDPAEEIGAFVMKEKPDHMSAGVADYLTFCQSPKVQDADLSFLKSAVCVDMMTLDQENLINGFLRNHEFPYLLSSVLSIDETASTVLTERGYYSQPGALGFPLCCTDAGVFEFGTDKELDFEAVGEICLSGPGLMLGYYNQPEATSSVLFRHQDGKVWYHSGMIGKVNHEGYFYLKLRDEDEVAPVESKNNFLSKIADRLERHQNVMRCVVVDIPLPQMPETERPFAFIKWHDESAETRKQALREIRYFCEKHIPDDFRPSEFISVRRFPQTDEGEIDYAVLKKQGMLILSRRSV